MALNAAAHTRPSLVAVTQGAGVGCPLSAKSGHHTKSEMAVHQFVIPANFHDYAYEVEAKGSFSGASLQYKGHQSPVSFYDATRQRLKD